MVVAGLVPQTARFPDGARARGCETARLVAPPPPAAARVVAPVLADPPTKPIGDNTLFGT